MSFFDYNTAAEQSSFDLIPKGTPVRIRMTIKPGGYDDAAQGWVGGWATYSQDTGSVYLACEGVVMEGPFARRKVWWNVGLHSPKGPTWQGMGRTFVRAALNSARNVHPGDNSPQAQAARRINGFAELDGIEFAARIDIERDAKGNDKNTIKAVIEPDHKDYAPLMGMVPKVVPPAGGTSGAPALAPFTAPAPAAAPRTPAIPGGKPAWAQ